MSYIGNTSTTQSFTPAIDYFSGNGSTVAFTLSRPVASVAQVQVVVNNVAQNPGTAFTVSGQTLTFTGAPSSGTNNIYVYYTSPITQVIAPGQGTVNTTQLVDGAVTTAKLSASTGSGAVTLASLPVFTTTLGVGNATPSASGAGITFPATQSASTDANTLDDYEEGTWTPNLGGTATYSGQSGRYTKIGNKVLIEASFTVSSIGTGSIGDVYGLPFTTNSSAPLGTISVGYWAATANSFSYVSATIGNNSTFVNLRGCAVAVNGLSALSFFQNGTTIYFTGQYTV